MEQNNTARVADAGTSPAADAAGIVARPTVLLGLGGTGLHVLYRVRRRIIDRYGSHDAIPILRFLWVDTDPAMEARIRSDAGIPGDQSFQDAEMVNAGIPDATMLYEGIERGNYPHYASWFSLGQLRTETNVSEGAGTIRQLGRVAFTYHYAEVQEKLHVAARTACTDQARQRSAEVLETPTADGLRIILCSSVAGGTGAGMFLDAAYLAQRLAGLSGVGAPLEVTGILTLPGAFVEAKGQDRREANAYAALKELNYFSYQPGGAHNPLAFLFGDTAFEAAYSDDPGGKVRHEQAPFDRCYLVDADNLEGVSVSAERVMDMIADYLFTDFASSLAGRKRSVGTDIAKQVGQATDGRDMPIRFFSLGMSTQSFPRAQVVEALAYRLAADVAKHWGKQLRQVTDSSQDGDAAVQAQAAWPEELLTAVRPHIVDSLLPELRLRQKADGTGGIVETIGLIEGNPLVDRPGTWANELKNRSIKEEWTPDETWCAKLEQARKTEDANYTTFGDDPAKWGYRIRQIVTNRDKHQRKVVDRLRTHVAGLMSDPLRGPDWALCMLEQLKLRLEADAQALQRQAEDAAFIAERLGDLSLIQRCRSGGAGLVLSNLIADERTRYYDSLTQAAKAIFPFGKLKRMKDLSDKFLYWAQTYQRAKTLEAMRTIGAEGLRSLGASCDSIAADARQAWQTMRDMQETLSEASEHAAERVRTMPVAGDVVYSQELGDALYTQMLAADPNADLDQLTKNLLTKFGVTWMTLPAAMQENAGLRDQMVQALFERCREIAGSIGQDQGICTDTGAVDILCKLHDNDKDLQDRLTQAWHQAAPYVGLDAVTKHGGWERANLRERASVGVYGGYIPDDPDPERARVNKLLLGQSGLGAPDITATQQADRIVLMREASGFPLRALTAAQQWKQQYERVIADKKQRPLHGCKQSLADAFPDLYPPDSLSDVYLCVDVGQAIGVVHPITIRDESGSVVQILGYSYALPSGVTDEVPLGTDPHTARVRLCREPELVATLVGEIQKFAEAADADERKAMAQKLRELLSARLAEVENDRQHPAYMTLLKVVNDFAVEHGLSLAAE